MYPQPLDGYEVHIVKENKVGGRTHDQVVVGEFLYFHIHSRLYYKAVFNCNGWSDGTLVTNPDGFKNAVFRFNRDKNIPVEDVELKSIRDILEQYGLGDYNGLEISLLRRFEYLQAGPDSRNVSTLENLVKFNEQDFMAPAKVQEYNIQLIGLVHKINLKNPPTNKLIVECVSEFKHDNVSLVLDGVAIKNTEYEVTEVSSKEIHITFMEFNSSETLSLILGSGLPGTVVPQ